MSVMATPTYDVRPLSGSTSTWNVIAIIGGFWSGVTAIWGVASLFMGMSSATMSSFFLSGGVSYSLQFVLAHAFSLACAIHVMVSTRSLLDAAAADPAPWEWWFSLTGASILHVALGFFGVRPDVWWVAIIVGLWLIPIVTTGLRLPKRQLMAPQLGPSMPMYRPGGMMWAAGQPMAPGPWQNQPRPPQQPGRGRAYPIDGDQHRQ